MLFPLALLLPVSRGIPYPSAQALYSDLAVSHYPYALFIQGNLAAGQGLPLWSPLILSGHPLAANPLSSFWYPPGWLALCLPLPLGLNLLAAAHLVWGGLGLARLLRVDGLNWQAAVFGGLAFALLPKLYAHYGAGHLTLLYAVPWTPWLLSSAAESPAIARAAAGQWFSRRLKNWNLKPGIILALIFLADPRWAAFAGTLWWVYVFSRSRSSLAPLLMNTALAALLAAPLALPLWEFTQLTTRAGLEPGEVFRYSLPPARLFGLLFPERGGFHEWILYPGALVFLLAALAVVSLISRPRTSRGQLDDLARPRMDDRQWRFWIWTAGLSLLFSLGSNLPIVSPLAQLPGISLLRVPPRALFLTGLSLAALAALAVNRLTSAVEEVPVRAAGRALVALASFAVTLALGIWKLSGIFPPNFVWGAAGTLAGAGWTGLRLGRKLTGLAWYAGLLALCCLDLLGVDRSLFSARPALAAPSEQRALVAYLQAQPGPFRVYSPSYSLPQQATAQAGLELADGVDPLQLEAYADFMEISTGVPRRGYSVTLPPMAGGDPDMANVAYRPDLEALGLLNVRFIAAEYDLPVDGLVLRGEFGRTRLYENLRAKPRAWLQTLGAAPGEDAQAVRILVRGSDRIGLEVENDSPGPRLLVLSELDYPGWVAIVDGRAVPIRPVAGLLRGVVVSPGRHQVDIRFRPQSVAWGVGLSAAALFLLLVRWIQGRRDHPVSGPPRSGHPQTT